MKEKKELQQIKTLYKKTKGLIKDKQNLSQFKEPIMMLIRKDKTVSFIEGVTKGEYIYEKSDKTQGIIELDPQFLLTFPYGDNIFRGYICYEDEYFPLPQKPIAYAEHISSSIEKVMNDKAKYKEGEYTDKGKMWKETFKGIAILIAVIIGGYIAAGLFGIDLPMPFGGEKEVIIKEVIQNTGKTLELP